MSYGREKQEEGSKPATTGATSRQDAARPLHVQLRGMNYADGAAMLSPQAPVQLAKGDRDKGKKSPEHRGRLQIQGGGLEKSWPWAQTAAPTSTEALTGLAGIWGTLSRREQKTRDEAYADAREYIASAAPDGVNAPISKTFQNSNLKQGERDHRVDIEVIKGTAFVG